MSEAGKPTLYYDGDCGLCNRAVRILAAIDKRDVFSVSPLQGGAGQAMLRRHGMLERDFDTMVIESGGKVYTKSDAVLEVFRCLGGWWRLAVLGSVIPRAVRDRLYMLVSMNRIRIFGKSDACPMPTESLRRKLASGAE